MADGGLAVERQRLLAAGLGVQPALPKRGEEEGGEGRPVLLAL